MSRKIRPDLEVLPPKVLYDAIAEQDDARLKALASLLYVTGCRISEAEEFTPRNITVKGDIAVFKILNLKNRAPSRRWKSVPVPIKRCRCLEDKFFSLIMDYMSGLDMFSKPFKFWARQEFSKANKKGELREYSGSNLHRYIGRKIHIRTVAYYHNGEQKVVEKELNPHYLRHARHTHLKQYYDVQPFDMMFFAGWSDIRMAMEYTHDAGDLEKVFK